MKLKVLILLCLPLFGAEFCPPLKDFTPEQKKILVDSYNRGETERLGLVLAAIAWHESCAGKFNINFADPSAGPFHVHLPNALRDKKLPDNAYNRNVIGQLLVNDFDYSSKLALNELLLWRAQYKGNVKNMIKSYNKGNSWRRDEKKNALAEKYYEDVDSKMKVLELVMPDLLVLSFKQRTGDKSEAKKDNPRESKAPERAEKRAKKRSGEMIADNIDQILEELNSSRRGFRDQPKFKLLEER